MHRQMRDMTSGTTSLFHAFVDTLRPNWRHCHRLTTPALRLKFVGLQRQLDASNFGLRPSYDFIMRIESC